MLIVPLERKAMEIKMIQLMQSQTEVADSHFLPSKLLLPYLFLSAMIPPF